MNDRDRDRHMDRDRHDQKPRERDHVDHRERDHPRDMRDEAPMRRERDDNQRFVLKKTKYYIDIDSIILLKNVIQRCGIW